MTKLPPGYKLLRRLRGEEWSCNAHRALVLALTFVAYACYHVSRKSTSIVKSVLVPGACSSAAWSVSAAADGDRLAAPSHCGAGWAPFNGADGTSKLGEIDVAFLACYSLAMFLTGHFGDRFNLRYFLAWGMIGSGFFAALFGMGYFWGVHAFGFYLAMQMLAGIPQATGWPSVVASVGNWFGQSRRGFIMGIWNAHTSVGNIAGSLLAASVLQYGWGWSFILPGALIACGGILVYLFLMPYPEDVGCDGTSNYHRTREIGDEEQEHAEGEKGRGGSAVGIANACSIPGVIPFAMCLFFSKLVAYTFLYWLPFYLSQTAIGGEYLSVKSAGNFSTFFDVGGIIGGILAGLISDELNSRAITAAAFMYFAIPSLYAYHAYGNFSWLMNIILMMVSGLFVNGPYALITTAVSADLGTHQSLKGDSRALATVTAIIDGTGSVGAALGPLLTGYLTRYSWTLVFRMLMIGAFISASLLFGLVRAEVSRLISDSRRASHINSVQHGAEDPVARPLVEEI